MGLKEQQEKLGKEKVKENLEWEKGREKDATEKDQMMFRERR